MKRRTFNIIDVLGLVLGIVVVGWTAAYVLILVQPVPQIQSVEPASIDEGETSWVTVKGRHLDRTCLVTVSNRRVPVITDIEPGRFRMLLQPVGIDLTAGRYSIRAVNSVGRGVWLAGALEVTPLRAPKEVPVVAAAPPLPTPSGTPDPTSDTLAAKAAEHRVTIEGRIWTADGSLERLMRAGDLGVTMSGRPTAKIVQVGNPRLREASRSRLMDAKWWVTTERPEYRTVSLELLADEQQGAYSYEGTALQPGERLLLRTPRYLADIELTDIPHPVEQPLVAEVMLQTPPDQWSIVQELRRGDFVQDSAGATVGYVIDRWVYASNEAPLTSYVWVSLRATVERGVLQVPDAEGPALKSLKPGAKLLLLTKPGGMAGTVVGRVAVKRIEASDAFSE